MRHVTARELIEALAGMPPEARVEVYVAGWGAPRPIASLPVLNYSEGPQAQLTPCAVMEVR